MKYVEINSVNPLYLIFSKAKGYFEEINKNKYLTLVSTNERKEITKNMMKFGVTSEVQLDQQLKTQAIMMKILWKSNLI